MDIGEGGTLEKRTLLSLKCTIKAFLLLPVRSLVLSPAPGTGLRERTAEHRRPWHGVQPSLLRSGQHHKEDFKKKKTEEEFM